MSCKVDRMLNTALPCSQCDVVAHICTMHTLVYVFFFSLKVLCLKILAFNHILILISL